MLRTTPSQLAPLARSDERFALKSVGVVVAFNLSIIILPMIYAVWTSFFDRDVILRTNDFVGLDHYRVVLSDTAALAAIGRSFEFTVTAGLSTVVISLFLALTLNEEFVGFRAVRSVILLPWAVSEVVSATCWIFMTSPTFGVLTGLTYRLGLTSDNYQWIDENTALYWVAVAFVWHFAPLGAFFLLAALQTVPSNLYNAARIDRANVLDRFMHVTVPHIRSTLMVVLVVITVEAFRNFDIMFALTHGGPGVASQTFPYLIFRYSFEFSRYGLASAAANVLVVIGMVLTILYYLVLSRRKAQIYIEESSKSA